MEDKTFEVYRELSCSLNGEIRDGCLHLASEVWGAYDSEQYINFDKENTDKLFSLISLDDFVMLCKKEHLIGLNKYLDANGIDRKTFTI